MADFIVINANKIESIAKLNVLKCHNIASSGLKESVETDMGDFPIFGSVSAVMIAYPELAAQKNKLYEAFSRRKVSTFYDQNSNILVCKSTKVTAKRHRNDEVVPEEIVPEVKKTRKAKVKVETTPVVIEKKTKAATKTKKAK
jgi:hypothetical protein